MISWHIIRAKPGAEGKALIGIGAARMQVFLPVERVHVARRGTSNVVGWRPLFPRYLFAAFDDALVMRLHELDGVADVLRVGERLATIPSGVIDELRAAQDAGMFDRRAAMLGFGVGEQVRIIDGPFAGLVARVSAARANKRIQIVVDFVHHMTVPVDKLARMRA